MIGHRSQDLLIIGRALKVSFQTLSDDGIPRFPVGISICEHDIEG